MSINIWDDCYPSGGSYWSNYTAAETNGAGIGIIDANNQDRYPLMNQWTPPHDIAITNVITAKTIVGQDLILLINATITNQGGYTETFDATAYADSTSIETKTISLTSGNSVTVTYM